MVSRNCRLVVFTGLCFYAVLLLIFTKLYIMNGVCCDAHKPLLEFTIQVKEGDKGEFGNNVIISGGYHNNNNQLENKNQEKLLDSMIVQRFVDTMKNTNIDVTDITKINTVSKAALESGKEKEQRKYLFSLRYYEQLARGTKNILSLASLSTYLNRHIVMPFVNNSRFSGLQSGVSISRFMELQQNKRETRGVKYGNLSTYFDIEDLNNKLKDNGYTSLVPFQEFQTNCKQLDIVIHFLYESCDRDIEKWYKVSPEKIREMRRRVKKNNGFRECKFLKRSNIQRFLSLNVTKYVCVDPEIITTAQELEDKVLQNSQCVGIVMWKGEGFKRTHFPLAPSITKELRPSNLKLNDWLKDIAYSYIRDIIKRPFISVHVRIERQLLKNGLESAKKCMEKLSTVVLQRRSNFHLKKIFVASDLGDNGSDTLQANAEKTHNDILQKEMFSQLEQPYRFDPKIYGLYDRGQIAIVEMHILSLGESLFTLGRGNFQDWVMELFLFHNAEDRSLIYKVCEIE